MRVPLSLPCPCWNAQNEAKIGVENQISSSSVSRSVVSVDAPEPFARQTWTRDKVRRLSLSEQTTGSSALMSDFRSNTGISCNSSRVRRDNKRYIRTLFHAQDNKITLKLFGSKRGVLEEQERQEQVAFYVIHPCSLFRIYWDLIMIAILAVNVTFLPIAIAFFKEDIEPGWVAFNCISDFLFIIDIVLNFFTGVITSENTVVLDLKEIRRQYMKKWFILDVISVFPFDYIVLGITQTAKESLDLFTAARVLRLLRLIKLLSLVRLLKLARFLRYLTKWEELLQATRSVLRIFNLILVMLLLAHWNGCVQFLVPYLQEFPRDSWVAFYGLQNSTISEQYTWSLFKAISHMLCIGYGRRPPQTITDTWLTIVSMLLGASFYAMFIGHISTLIHAVDSPSRQYNEKLNQVDEYMRYRKLPHEIKQRVHEYYYHRYQGQLFNESAILGELSAPLREQITQQNCQELVRSVPFLANASESFVNTIITKLEFEVYLPGDYVLRYGSLGHHMYFIQNGTLDVLTKDGAIVTSLSEGSYFGEICLLLKSRRVASVRTVTVCDLYSLSVENFHSVLKEYPDILKMMEVVANERLTVIGNILGSDNIVNNSNAVFADKSTTKLSPIKEYDSKFCNPEDIV